MTKNAKSGGLLAAVLAAGCGLAAAHDNDGVDAIPQLDHVFVIMMENHGYSQVVGNPDAPFINAMLASGKVNVAAQYYGVGHPSLTNYLEVVGGSNFGVRSDNGPAWHNTSCAPNLSSGILNADQVLPAPAQLRVESGTVCPIAGIGQDADTPAIDNWNEVTPGTFNFLADIDGQRSVPARTDIYGMTIADQLAQARRTWKSYQETLPNVGADNVTFSNGTVTDLTFAKLPGVANLPASPGGYVLAYAAKHNPFVYFKSVQENSQPGLGLANVVGFDGIDGLYADLATGNVPAYSFIAPNQCNDQHGRGNGDSFCGWDPAPNGTLTGLNPGLIAQGDATVERIVTSIKASPAWRDGRNAIVLLWDENDYSGVAALASGGGSAVYPVGGPNNRVLTTVETNYRKSPAVVSNRYYNHYALLRTIEAGLELPCLNHACDKDSALMTDLFGR